MTLFDKIIFDGKKMKMQEIKDFLIDEIERRHGIHLNEEYDVPLLKFRKLFKAYDLVSLLCMACEKYGVKLEQLGEYDQPITINGLCQYISKHVSKEKHDKNCIHR